ncbi:MAG: hypothetical protein MPF33_02285 [Candidatus Aramenus sp.]|jgi:tetratricopeptide (TPR) repeat protein|nr:hypothetical protein [Candidatus Aramenus sp.]
MGGEDHNLRAVSLINDGEKKVKLGEVTEAEQSLKRALLELDEAIKEEDSPKYHYNKGVAYLNLARAYSLTDEEKAMESLEEALREFEVALKHSDKGVFHNGRGTALAEMARLRRNKGDDVALLLEEAIREFSKAILMEPEEPSYRVNLTNVVSFLAESKALSGDLEETERLLSKVVEEYEKTSTNDPDLSYANAVTLMEMAMVRKQLGKVEQARKDLEVALAELDKAIAKNPISSDYHNARGNALLLLSEVLPQGEIENALSEAVKEFDEAVWNNPMYPFYHVGKANVLVKLSQLSAVKAEDYLRQAISEYSEVLQIAKDNPDYLTLRAKAYLELGKATGDAKYVDEAVKDLDRASRYSTSPEIKQLREEAIKLKLGLRRKG